MTDYTEADRLVAVPRPDADVVSLLEAIFTDYRSKRQGSTVKVDFDADLWKQLDDLGLSRLTGDESRGGSEASWLEASALLGLAAAAVAPVPIAEHDLLGSWLLEVVGLSEHSGVRTVCQPDATGLARAVLWGRSSDSVVALWRFEEAWRVADVPADHLTVTEERNLAGEPSDVVQFRLDDLRAGTPVPDDVAAQYRLRGALARCAQIVGAMDRVVEVVLAHANARVQFGRPLGKFQAVQTLVADLAAEASLARAATDTAVAHAVAYGFTHPAMLFHVGVAKSCVGHASSVVVRNAHQALGAIGATLEHELPGLTRLILARRGDFGSMHEWDMMLTRLATRAGREGLWPLLTAGEVPEASSSLSLR